MTISKKYKKNTNLNILDQQFKDLSTNPINTNKTDKTDKIDKIDKKIIKKTKLEGSSINKKKIKLINTTKLLTS